MELKETVEVTTPLTSKKVVLRGYITGRIKQEVESIFLKGASVKAGGDSQQDITFDASVSTAATNKALELIVLSVDGQSDGILDRVLDLPEQDYDFVRAEVEKIQQDLGKKK